MNFKIKYSLYHMPFMDYIIFELSFLVVASQVSFYRYTFSHITKDLISLHKNSG